MKILRITESQYKRLVSKKNLNEQNKIVYKDIKDEDDVVTQELKYYLYTMADAIYYNINKDLYIDKIEDGVVYINWDKYSETEKKIIIELVDLYVELTNFTEDKHEEGDYYSGSDLESSDLSSHEHEYDPEDWPGHGTNQDVVVIDEPDVEEDDVNYVSNILLTYSNRARKDLNKGIINPKLINDIINALKSINMTAKIKTAQTGHCLHVKCDESKPLSRHGSGNAVDIYEIGGETDKDKHTISNKGECDKCNKKFMENGDKLVEALKKLGYKYGEGNHKKSYIWRSDAGGNHYDHVHVSNTNR